MFLASVGWVKTQQNIKVVWNNLQTTLPYTLTLTCFVYNENGLEEETGFVWDGRYTYIYTDSGSYEPLAQVHNRINEEGERRQQTHYFHCDQIGIPREMADKDGNFLWFGNYTGWGRLKEETKVTDSAYQPFHLQNQYADRETGLPYEHICHIASQQE